MIIYNTFPTASQAAIIRPAMARIALFSVAFLVVNQAALLATPRIITATEIEKKLHFYQKIHTLKAHFTQKKRLKKLQLVLESSGEMELVRPDRVIWKVVKPAPLEMVLIKNHIEITSGTGAEKKEQHIELGKTLDETTSKGIVSLLAWLQINVKQIVNDYIVTENSTSEYRCVPKDEKNRMLSSLTFFLHPKGHVSRLLLEELSGDELEIVFSLPDVTYIP